MHLIVLLSIPPFSLSVLKILGYKMGFWEWIAIYNIAFTGNMGSTYDSSPGMS
jgi:hypothetical protein